MKRRTFLLGSLGVAGGTAAFIVGWAVLPARQRMYTSVAQALVADSVPLNGWVSITADGRVIVALARSEMGQGVSTALPMLVAEELDADWKQVSVANAPADKIYGNVSMLVDGLPFLPEDHSAVRRVTAWIVGKAARELGLMVTGGSSSVRDAWLPMRQAGAAARATLVAEAARRWQVGVVQCSVSRGVVEGPAGQKLGFGELVSAWIKAGEIPPGPEHFALKEASQFELIGTPVARTDSAQKSRGKAQFGIDVRVPGMVYAAPRMAPVIGSAVATLDTSDALKSPGVLQVVTLAPFLGQAGGFAVVAEHYWQARQALDRVKVTWTGSPHADVDSAALSRERASALTTPGGLSYRNTGDVDKELAGGAGILVEAVYEVPYLAHAAMEPTNCTAQVRVDSASPRVAVWAPTQVPSIARMVAARIAEVDTDDVALEVTFLGGGFGRRLEVDFIAQAVAIAKQTGGRAVQLIWSREDDVQHDYYRPAASAQFRGRVEAGRIHVLENRVACDAITPQVMRRDWPLLGADSPDKTTVEGSFDMPYEIDHLRVTHKLVKTPVNIGFWRSVGHSYNAFFVESFIDELAASVKGEPYQFRRAHLAHHPRHLAVLDLAAQKHGWGLPLLPANSEDGAPIGRGIALHESFGSIVAEVVDVSILDERIRVHRVTCAIDCGTAVNPGIIAQQMESGIVFGLSAALYGKVTFNAGRVEQSNFSDYPVVRSNGAPLVSVHIVPSTAAPSGAGEVAVPPIAAAVANAVFGLTGKRLRSLPLNLA